MVVAMVRAPGGGPLQPAGPRARSNLGSFLGLGGAGGLLVDRDQVRTVVVRPHVVGHQDGHVGDQLFQRLPRAVLVLVPAPTYQEIDLAIGVDDPVVKRLDHETLGIMHSPRGQFFSDREVGAGEASHLVSVYRECFVFSQKAYFELHRA